MNLTAQKDNGCKTFQRCDENVTNFQQSGKKKESRCSTTTLRQKFIVTPGNENYRLTYGLHSRFSICRTDPTGLFDASDALNHRGDKYHLRGKNCT